MVKMLIKIILLNFKLMFTDIDTADKRAVIVITTYNIINTDITTFTKTLTKIRFRLCIG